ncbi:MAG: cupin domain-containing protein [Pirellulales bacterium]|nr:cupin domain-containing protein [Pirellulales bacterium]
MPVNHYETVTQEAVDMDGAEGCQVRWLIGQDDGAPHFAMRQYEVASVVFTPRHQHPYEHEVFILEGQGVLFEGDVEQPLRAGDVAFVAPDQLHQFRNTGETPLKFLCLIPHVTTDSGNAVSRDCTVE